jgi:hypothetical protein
MTLIHEMVHALQDQHMNLHALREADRDSDPGGAFMSIVEGDATLAMMGYAAQTGGIALEELTRSPGTMRSLLAQTPAFGRGELGQAPAILQYTLVSPYLDGVIFAAALHGRGGWPAIDRTYATLPTTTEQVLHPERYFAGEGADPATIPPLPSIERAGFRMIEEDTLGELEISVYLGQGAPDQIDRVAAEGWGGDRLRVYRSDTESAVVWFTSWDDEAQAREAEAAARRVMDAVPAGSRTTHRVERIGRAIVILRGLPPALHDDALRPFRTWAQSLPAHPPRLVSPSLPSGPRS